MLDARELMFARQSIVTHAKAFNLDAIDLVDINYKGEQARISKGGQLHESFFL